MRLLAKDLKDSILQAAIQGKLVEQRAEEGTAEELYQQIQEEKQRLIAEKKIKKEKPLPEITADEKPFDIPDSWKWARFGELGNYKKGPFGSALTKNMFVPKGNGSIKVYEQKNAIQKDANIGEYYIDRNYFESKMTGFEVMSGDIIVSCAGTIGETFILPENIERGIINQALMRMRIFNPIFIPYFLVFFDVVLKQNAIASSKGSAIKNIPPFDVLKNYLVPLPPLAEQKRIVEKIEQILPHIDQYEKMEKDLEKLEKEFPEDMKNSLLQAAMQGKLTEQLESDGSVDDLIEQIKVERHKLEAEGKIKKSRKTNSTQQNNHFVQLETIPFEIPSNWKFQTLKSVTIINGGYAFKSTNYSQNGIRIIRISDFNNNGLLFEDIIRYPYSNKLLPFKIKKNDILLGMIGSTVRKCCIITSCNEDMVTNQKVANISSICINPKFLYFSIKSPYFQNLIKNNLSGIIPGISLNKIKELSIVIPPLEEQQRIVEILDKLLPLCEAL